MTNSINNISTTTPINVDDDSSQNTVDNTENEKASTQTPDQPLPSTASHTSMKQLWDMIQSSVRNASAGTLQNSKAAADAQRVAIQDKKQAQIDSLNERAQQLKDQNAHAHKHRIFNAIKVALAVVISVAFPAVAPILLVPVVISTVIPAVANKIMVMAGVPDDVRNKVMMGIHIAAAVVNIAIGIAMIIATGGAAAGAKAAQATAKAAKVATKTAKVATKAGQVAEKTSKARVVANKAAEAATKTKDAFKAFGEKIGEHYSSLSNMTSAERTHMMSRISRAQTIFTSVSSIIGGGANINYNVKQKQITDEIIDTDIDKQRAETLQTQLQSEIDNSSAMTELAATVSQAYAQFMKESVELLNNASKV